MSSRHSGSWPDRLPRGGFPYAPLLAVLRTRLLGAVVMPALIGAGYGARGGEVRALPLAFVLAGLAAAELLNLFGTDYAQWRGRSGDRRRARANGGAGGEGGAGTAGTGTITLPGNPVVPPSRLDPARIPAAMLPLAVLGLAALVYFTIAVGPVVLIFFVAAAAVGGLYVFSPFPYAFLSTVVLPPLIAGATHLALTGGSNVGAFAAGLPVAWISVAVILGYRVHYTGSQGLPAALLRRRGLVVLAFYLLAGANVAAWVSVGLLPPVGLLALVPWAGCLAWVAALLGRELSDPVPATTVGVLMHSTTSAALALALWLG